MKDVLSVPNNYTEGNDKDSKKYGTYPVYLQWPTTTPACLSVPCARDVKFSRSCTTSYVKLQSILMARKFVIITNVDVLSFQHGYGFRWNYVPYSHNLKPCFPTHKVIENSVIITSVATKLVSRSDLAIQGNYARVPLWLSSL